MQNDLEGNIYLVVIMCTCGIALLVIAFVVIFSHNQKKLLKQKELAQQEALQHQKALLYATIQSQEDERKRIGQDLHDDVGGALSNLRMLLNSEARNGTAGQEQETAHHKKLIDQIIDDVRNISHNLSPPALALFGFDEALNELKHTLGKGKADSFFSITNHAEVVTEQLPQPIALALIRVLQQLITNTVRHANAKHIGISLFVENDCLCMHYTDDGKGFAVESLHSKKGMGMRNIDTRLNMIGATYTIKTATNEGFSIFIRLPNSKIG